MGVHGLWKLIEPAGKPIPLESLENKVLAVDVSIWLYQLTKGFQTTGGGAVPNAHLLGLFNRICKLLYYRIKPVFVFDGGVPLLKKETIEARKRMKRKAQDTSEQLREKLLDNLLKQNAVNQLLGNADLPSTSSQSMEDMFALPPLPEKEESDKYDSESDTEVATAKIESFCDSQCGKDLHSIDITSEQFKSLPPEIRHEILSELQETRKQNSWAKIHEMPEQSQDFSKFQMERLRKRRNVQISLDTAAKEMGGRSMTLGELENLFREDGIVTDSLPGQRIIGDNVTRFVYITGKSKEKEKLQPEIETGTQIEEKSVKKAKEFDESDFHTKIQVIEECIFINDSSSEDDIDIINETKNSDISQEDLLKIIKQEQIQNNDEERVDEIDSYSISKRNEPVAGIEIVEATQTPNTRKISDGFSISVPLIEESQSNSESQEMVFSELSDSYSVELFAGSDSQNLVNSNNQAATISELRVNKCPSLRKEPEYVKTVPVSIHNELNAKNNFSDNKSVELFSESESDDDFVEVTDCSQPSSYFKVPEKTLEISINPDVKVEDDIFADIFDEAISENKNTGDERNVQSIEKKPEQTKELNNPKLDVHPIEKKSERTTKELNKPKQDIHPIEKKSERTKELNEPNKLTEILTKVKKAEEEIAAVKPSECKQSPSKNQKSTEENNELSEIQKMLSTEQNELLAEHGKQERLGSTITQQMIIEAQELLQLFGLPYLVAPMEAEAQCAFLDQISLTEGTITDDSDIWLFGGQKVYKNFFDNRKYVLQFRAIDIEHFFKLSREQLIQMALLVGSDYTVGIEGVGPVTALEILAYFSDPSNKPQTESDKSDIGETLRRFRLWLKTNRNSSTPLSKKCRNVTLSEAFPNTSVIEAYLYPTVNESKEGFSWATPDLDKIRQYMRSKFGWKSSRIDEILLPVMKRLLNKNKQSTLDSYFKAKSFAPLDFGHVSKRVIQAINVMKNKTNEVVLPIPSTSKSPKKREIILKTPIKKEKITRTRKKKSPLSASTSIKSMSPHKTTYFSSALSLKEKDKLEAAKRKVEAIKIFQAKNKCKRKTKIQKTLPAKADSSYLSESSGDEI